jgi:hypothetical protein
MGLRPLESRILRMANGTTDSSSPSVPSDLSALAARILLGDTLAEPLFRCVSQRGLKILIKHRIQSDVDVDTLAARVIDETIQALRNGTSCGEDVSRWMCGTARRVALEWMAQTRRPESDAPSLTEAPADDVDGEAVRAFSALTDIRRRVATLFYVRRQATEAICAEVGLTPAEFESTKSSIRKQMRQASTRRAASCVVGCA